MSSIHSSDILEKTSKMKLITKMASLVVTMLIISIILASLGIINMKRSGTDLHNISQTDIPLLGAITVITLTQLKQSIYFERSLNAAEIRNWVQFEEAESEQTALVDKIVYQFETANNLIAIILKNNKDDDTQTKYLKLQKELNTINADYIYFSESIAELLGLMKNENISRGDIDFSMVKEQVQSTSDALQALTVYINNSTVLTAKAAKSRESSATDTMIFVTVAALILSLLLAVWILRGISRQLGGDPAELVTIADSLASGDLMMMHNQSMTGVFGSINATVNKLKNIISGIKTSANEVHLTAEQVSQGNINLSQRTQEQASSLEQVASSMEEMTSTINQNAQNATLTNELAQTATEQAKKGTAVVRDTVDAMEEIDKSSKKIAEIIHVIDDIAFQTNLLALNAAVEAARAGEHGRGFAVVATEVRNLAGKSATAATEIKGLISDSLDRVKEGVKLANDSGLTLNEIETSVQKASMMATEIATASHEQSEGIEQVNKALLQMDEMTQQNASLVEEAAAASEAMGAQAQELIDMVSYFNLGTEAQITPVKQIHQADVTHEQPAIRNISKVSRPALENDEDEWKEF